MEVPPLIPWAAVFRGIGSSEINVGRNRRAG